MGAGTACPPLLCAIATLLIKHTDITIWIIAIFNFICLPLFSAV
jgi:hypothetical protein